MVKKLRASHSRVSIAQPPISELPKEIGSAARTASTRSRENSDGSTSALTRLGHFCRGSLSTRDAGLSAAVPGRDTTAPQPRASAGLGLGSLAPTLFGWGITRHENKVAHGRVDARLAASQPAGSPPASRQPASQQTVGCVSVERLLSVSAPRPRPKVNLSIYS